MSSNNYDKTYYIKLTKIFLYLVALHSFVVAIALMFSPSWLMEYFGYSSIGEPFFKVQAGVFHIVMVAAYLFAASEIPQNRVMLVFTVTIKFIATAFLVIYYMLVDSILVILLSGIGDFIMGLILLYFYQILFNNNKTDDR